MTADNTRSVNHAERPPRVKLPARALKWAGPWQLVKFITVGPKGRTAEGRRWMREYIEDDGHVDCCRHIDFVTRPYKGEVER